MDEIKHRVPMFRKEKSIIAIYRANLQKVQEIIFLNNFQRSFLSLQKTADKMLSFFALSKANIWLHDYDAVTLRDDAS